jgi:hypothetical protein
MNGRKRLWPDVGYYPRKFLEELKTTENLRPNNGSLLREI